MRFHSSTGKAARAAMSRASCLVDVRAFLDSASSRAPRLEVITHDGVAEVDRPPAAVGEAALVEDLQQELVHVAVGLLDLVEQHHAVRVIAAAGR
jgi:hypothetical protein